MLVVGVDVRRSPAEVHGLLITLLPGQVGGRPAHHLLVEGMIIGADGDHPGLVPGLWQEIAAVKRNRLHGLIVHPGHGPSRIQHQVAELLKSLCVHPAAQAFRAPGVGAVPVHQQLLGRESRCLQHLAHPEYQGFQSAVGIVLALVRPDGGEQVPDSQLLFAVHDQEAQQAPGLPGTVVIVPHILLPKGKGESPQCVDLDHRPFF